MFRLVLLYGLFGNFLTTGALAATPSESHPSLGKGSTEIQWRSDIHAATREVFRDNRPMLVLFTMDGCGYCQLMKRTTYSDEQVTARVNEHFVPIRVHGAENRRLAQRLGVRVYPTTVIISPENRVVDRMDGYVKPQAMLAKLAIVVNSKDQSRAAVPATTSR